MQSYKFKSLAISALVTILAAPIVLCAQDADDHSHRHPRIVTFDAPHAGRGPGSLFCFGNCPGTVAENANREGAVTGYYVDDSSVFHGFVRDCDGELTEFDAPGAAGLGTVSYSINSDGAITGIFQDASGVFEGFLRSRKGKFTTFTIPGQTFGPGQGVTAAANINDQGEIAGYWTDSNSVYHGFVRHSNGKIESFDAPGSAMAPNFAPQGTVVALESALNDKGDLTGWYFDSSQAVHGYVREKDGTFTTFDDSLGGNGFFEGTIPGSINRHGDIAGGVADASLIYHGFVRSRRGEITSFEAPESGNTPGQLQGTLAVGINDAGEVTAYVTDNNNVAHGTVRDCHGHFVNFDVSAAGTGQGQGTIPQGINDEGAVPGYYTDANNVNHGFIRLP